MRRLMLKIMVHLCYYLKPNCQQFRELYYALMFLLMLYRDIFQAGVSIDVTYSDAA